MDRRNGNKSNDADNTQWLMLFLVTLSPAPVAEVLSDLLSALQQLSRLLNVSEDSDLDSVDW